MKLLTSIFIFYCVLFVNHVLELLLLRTSEVLETKEPSWCPVPLLLSLGLYFTIFLERKALVRVMPGTGLNVSTDVSRPNVNTV